MHALASVGLARCACRACVGNRASLRRIERDVIADLRRMPDQRPALQQPDEAAPGDGETEIAGGFRLTWSTRVYASTEPGSLAGVRATLLPRLENAFARVNGVYQFLFGDRLAYIGRTKNVIKSRINAHFGSAQRLDPKTFSAAATECDSFDFMLGLVCARKLWPSISVRCADASKIVLPRGQGLDLDVKGSHALELLLQDKHRARLVATVNAFLYALSAKDPLLSKRLTGKLIGYNHNTAYYEDE